MNDKRFQVLGSNRFYFGEKLLEGITLIKTTKYLKMCKLKAE